MEVIYSELKQKDVINVADGKHLGRVCDITFTFPEGKVNGLTVTGGKGFRLTRQDMFLPLKSVVKIGEDAVLVNLCPEPPPPPKNPSKCAPPPSPQFAPPPPPQSRRSLDEYE